MVMKSYSEISYAKSYLTYNGANPTLQNRVFRQNVLGGITSRHGNYRDPNPHKFEKTRIQRRSGLYSQNHVPTSQLDPIFQVSGVMPTDFSWSVDELQSWDRTAKFETVRAMVLEKMYEKVRGSLDLSIDFMEHQKVRQMVVGRAEKSIAGLIRTFRYIRHAPSKLAAQAWLEYTYGWKPLASSIAGIMKEAVNPQDGVIRVRERARLEGMPRHELNSIYHSGFKDLYQGSTSYRIESYSCWNPNNEALMMQLGRISSLNPVSVAYELIPYSFVVDWFYDLGGYLRLYESATMYSSAFIKGWECATSRVSFKASCTGDSVSSGIHTSIDEVGYREQKTYDRKLYSSAPWPQLPKFRSNVGASRILSGSALARGFIPRKWTRLHY